MLNEMWAPFWSPLENNSKSFYFFSLAPGEVEYAVCSVLAFPVALLGGG